MKAKKIEKIQINEKDLPKGVTINPSLEGKYNNDPYFQKKVDQANYILKTYGIPPFKSRG